MDAQLLDVVQSIRWLLVVLVVIGVINACLAATRVWIAFRSHMADAESTLFRSEADGFVETNRYDTLLAKCSATLAAKPNHTDALWYRAKALYALKQYGEARTTLDRLAEVEPSWVESHIAPMLAQIDELEFAAVLKH